METAFAAVIVAAGRGLRAGGGEPKQYRPLAGRPVLRHALDRMLARRDLCALVVVIHPEDAGRCAAALGGIDDPRLRPPVAGGATRAESVRAGLAALADLDPATAVLIHDAARPFVPDAVIDGVLRGLESSDGALPVLPVVDALWRGDSLADQPLSRDGLWRAQTPQGFRLGAIRAAHAAHAGPADDDAVVARIAGLRVALTPGAEENFKITAPGDFVRAARIVEAALETRTGQGFDVHRFGPGDHVMLGGIAVPHDRGVVAHSDGDVVLHALTDAVLGALAEGDIGRWFPPSDPRWRGAASDRFLAHAVRRVAERGGRILHADLTVLCERPRIGPHAAAMRARIADILGVDARRVSVKATTTEGLGFTGRGEGIAAMATATVALPADR